ncbi:unnamed protein product [Caenorhabditis angaria]|uniref:DMAP1-binding domain-containing protein n=1 Tax=Caenorhabditis angaria TaxID=860376 RepID=A0A9P1I2X5_9PELO|nr:unnamed protein product [Caenorhabditis angaria]
MDGFGIRSTTATIHRSSLLALFSLVFSVSPVSVQPKMIDLDTVPDEIREKLAELELELSEGDITKKGYDKKRGALLAAFQKSNAQLQGSQAIENEQKSKEVSSPNSRTHRRQQRRVTRDEDRYHSEIRVEAVHQALAEYSDGRKLGPQALKPHRRNNTSVSRNGSSKRKSSSNKKRIFR